METGDRKGEGAINRKIGDIFNSLGEYQMAKEYYEKALAIRTETGEGKEQEYLNLGIVYGQLRKYRRAKEYLEKVVRISIASGDRTLEAHATGSLAAVFAAVNDNQKAEEHPVKALTISRECGDRNAEGTLNVSLSNFYRSLGEFSKAEDYIEKAYSISSQIGNKMLAELMADKYSLESHISADPQSWFGIENVVRRESNPVFLYIAYRERKVHLWVLKANGDICFRKTDEVEVDTLIDEQVCDVEGIFKKSAAGFGVLPTANCED